MCLHASLDISGYSARTLKQNGIKEQNKITEWLVFLKTVFKDKSHNNSTNLHQLMPFSLL